MLVRLALDWLLGTEVVEYPYVLTDKDVLCALSLEPLYQLIQTVCANRVMYGEHLPFFWGLELQ